jgi:hypothetical protein
MTRRWGCWPSQPSWWPRTTRCHRSSWPGWVKSPPGVSFSCLTSKNSRHALFCRVPRPQSSDLPRIERLPNLQRQQVIPGALFRSIPGQVGMGQVTPRCLLLSDLKNSRHDLFLRLQDPSAQIYLVLSTCLTSRDSRPFLRPCFGRSLDRLGRVRSPPGVSCSCLTSKNNRHAPFLRSWGSKTLSSDLPCIEHLPDLKGKQVLLETLFQSISGQVRLAEREKANKRKVFCAFSFNRQNVQR